MKVRIKFAKHGAMRFIGHLGIIRYFQKAMRRANVDIKYNEDFNPHQTMSFTAPLDVGLTSNREYIDVEVNSVKNSEAMVHQLNEVMVKGVEVLSRRRLEGTAENTMSMVAAVDYTMRLRNRTRLDNVDAFFEELISFYGWESIVIMKKAKRGGRRVDLKPLIYDPHREGDTVFPQLSTGGPNNIKSELALEAFYSGKGQAFSELDIQIQRGEAYGNTRDEEHRVLTPLEDFREDIE